MNHGADDASAGDALGAHADAAAAAADHGAAAAVKEQEEAKAALMMASPRADARERCDASDELEKLRLRVREVRARRRRRVRGPILARCPPALDGGALQRARAATCDEGRWPPSSSDVAVV